MLEDLKKLWGEFDLELFTNPQGLDGFIMSGIAFAVAMVVGYVILKLILGLFT